MTLVLHDYWRSSASYRVRIALNLKALDYAQVAHDLRTGAQRDAAYLAIAPQGRVPALEADGIVLNQSLAIVEWLEETHPLPRLLPEDPADRAVVRAMATLVACDIHPLNNLPVLQLLRTDMGASEEALNAWIARWISQGFAALERMVNLHGGAFTFGDSPTMADCCLIPQVYSARRFGVDLQAYPRIIAVHDRCMNISAFSDAEPSNQPDADQ